MLLLSSKGPSAAPQFKIYWMTLMMSPKYLYGVSGRNLFNNKAFLLWSHDGILQAELILAVINKKPKNT